MNTDDLLTILSSMTLNHRLILEVNDVEPKPFALVFDNPMDFYKVANVISTEPVIVTRYSKNVELISALSSENCSTSSAVFYQINSYKETSLKQHEKIEMFLAAAMSRKVGDKPSFAAKFLVFGKVLPEEFYDQVVPIYVPKIEKSLSRNCSDIESLIPSQDLLGLVKHRIMEDKIEGIFKIAVAFLYPRLMLTNRLEQYDHLMRLAEEMENEKNKLCDRDAVVELLVDQFNDYISGSRAVSYRLPRIDIEDEKKYDNAFFYKGDKVYVSEMFFQKIVGDDFLHEISINQLKRILSEKDMIVKDGDEHYTTKMNYRNSSGMLDRKRMICFFIDDLSLPGEESFRGKLDDIRCN